jgi:hypothetical protein
VNIVAESSWVSRGIGPGDSPGLVLASFAGDLHMGINRLDSYPLPTSRRAPGQHVCIGIGTVTAAPQVAVLAVTDTSVVAC